MFITCFRPCYISSRTTEEEEVDKSVKEALDSEDMDIIIDLRELNEGRAFHFQTVE